MNEEQKQIYLNENQESIVDVILSKYKDCE